MPEQASCSQKISSALVNIDRMKLSLEYDPWRNPPGESLRWLLVTFRIPGKSEQCAAALTHDAWSAILNVVNVASSHHF